VSDDTEMRFCLKFGPARSLLRLAAPYFVRKVPVKTPSSRETMSHRYSGQAINIKSEEDADLGSRPRYRREYAQRSSQRLQRPCARCGCSVMPQPIQRSASGDHRFTRLRTTDRLTGLWSEPPWRHMESRKPSPYRRVLRAYVYVHASYFGIRRLVCCHWHDPCTGMAGINH
jgi:hypothetical protein